MPMSEKRFNKKLEKIKKQGERYKQEKELKDAYAQYVPDRKKRKVSNVMLTVVVIATTAYAIASFCLAYITGVNIDPTLTTCFYALWSGELLGLVTIKIGKVVKHKDNNDYANNYVNTYDDDCDNDSDSIG